MKIVRKFVGMLLLLAGLAIFLSPDVYSLWFAARNRQVIEDFQAEYGQTENAQNEVEVSTAAENTDELFRQIGAYNQRIFAEKQSEITDAWTFAQDNFEITLEDDLFGVIEIPAMDVTLPLYLGATAENMAKGAAVLGGTSLPIGGENTNAVIAGHRGYRGAPYFREIEKLAVGDEVFITNPWETLTYTVTEIVVVQPDDSDAVLIQPGRDMVTLVTCHPYRSHGKYRYLVYCERKNNTGSAVVERGAAGVKIVDGEGLVSSDGAIKGERWLRWVGVAVNVAVAGWGISRIVKNDIWLSLLVSCAFAILFVGFMRSGKYIYDRKWNIANRTQDAALL